MTTDKPTTTTTSYGCTYVHTSMKIYTEKRIKKEGDKDLHITFHDGKILDEIKILSIKENTDISSIFSTV